MGLDMYLNKVVYVGGEYANKSCAENIVSYTLKTFGCINDIKFKVKDISAIVTRVGYWRKANAIHAWFVTNIQHGEDDCKEYQVMLSELITLKTICANILKEKTLVKKVKLAKTTLPTSSGFFFGSVNYDEYYFQDLKDTITIIDNILKDKSSDEYTYFYHASW